MSNEIKISYFLSTGGQREALRRGIPAQAEQGVRLLPASEMWNRAIELAAVCSDGSARINLARPLEVAETVEEEHPTYVSRAYICVTYPAGSRRVVKQSVLWDAPQAPEDLVAWEELRRGETAVVQEEEEELFAETKEQQRAARRAAFAAWLDEQPEAFKRLPEIQELLASKDPGDIAGHSRHQAKDLLGEFCREQHQAEYLSALPTPELRSAAEACIDEHGSKWDWEDRCQLAVAATKERQEMARWIPEHGSDHLKRVQEEGIKCGRLYRNERLALERPGWIWEQATPGGERDIVNPDPDAIALLDRARETAPGARLVWWTVAEELDDEGFPDVEESQGPACLAEFLGREITLLP